MDELARVVKQTNAWACYDCGKCTATCPVARVGGGLSPRRHVLAAVTGQSTAALSDGSLAACLTCGLCDERCPAKVRFTDLVLELRRLQGAAVSEPECPHGGALQSMMRMMARGTTTQKRLGWLEDHHRVAPTSGPVLLWTGCTPYYDAFFPELGAATLNGTRAAVEVLNALGIEPVVSAEERCCGHDLLWNGDCSELRGARPAQPRAGGGERGRDAGHPLRRVPADLAARLPPLRQGQAAPHRAPHRVGGRAARRAAASFQRRSGGSPTRTRAGSGGTWASTRRRGGCWRRCRGSTSTRCGARARGHCAAPAGPGRAATATPR